MPADGWIQGSIGCDWEGESGLETERAFPNIELSRSNAIPLVRGHAEGRARTDTRQWIHLLEQGQLASIVRSCWADAVAKCLSAMIVALATRQAMGPSTEPCDDGVDGGGALLLAIFAGFSHAPALDELTSPGLTRWALGIVALLLFLLIVVPARLQQRC